MNIVSWMVVMLVAVLLGRWMGEFAVLGEVRTSQLEEVAIVPAPLSPPPSSFRLRSHPCLNAPLESMPDHLAEAQERSVAGLSSECLVVLACWFQLDREHLFKWLADKRNPEPMYAIVTRWWAQDDLDAVWEEFDKLTGGNSGSKPLFRALRLEDPARASLAPDALRSSVITDWALKDFAAAEQRVKEVKRWEKRRAVADLAKAKVVQVPFEEALAWANSSEIDRDTAVVAVIDELARTDLEGALRHLLESGVAKPTHLNNTERALRELPLVDALDLLGKYPVPSPWLFRGVDDLPENPKVAAELLTPLTQHLDRVGLHTNWSPESDNIVESLTYLAKNPDNPVHHAILEKSLEHWSRRHPEEINAWIKAEPDRDRQARYAHDFGGRNLEMVNLVDPDVLGADLNHALVYQNIKYSITPIAQMNPTRAIVAAESLQFPQWRAVAYRSALESWAEHDERAAIDWAMSLSIEDRSAAEIPRILKSIADRIQ